MATGSATSTAPAEVLGEVRALVSEELGEVLWAAKRPEEVLAVVAEIERLKSSLEAIELSAVAEVQATKAASRLGYASAKDFVTAVSGGRHGSGGTTLRLAGALTGELRATHRALADGRVSRPQVEVIASCVDALPSRPSLRARAEAVLLDWARSMNASELAANGKGLVAELDPAGDDRKTEKQLARDERAAHLGRFLSIVEDGCGGVRIKGRATVEAAAVIKAALMPLAAPAPADPGSCGGDGACAAAGCAHDGRDPREHGTRFLDALVEGCQRLLDAEVLPAAHGAKPRITLTMDYAALRDGVGQATLDTGSVLSASVVRRLACDADVIPTVLGTLGEVLDVGRMQRLVTPAIWRALVVRDAHCRFPGCTRPPIACDAHHIEHWIDGGDTSLANMVLLCRAHHTMIHNTPWQVRLNPVDQRPEFIPPRHLHPDGTPVRIRYPRD